MSARSAAARVAWGEAFRASQAAQAAALAAWPPYASRTCEQDLAFDAAIVARDTARAAERAAFRTMRELSRVVCGTGRAAVDEPGYIAPLEQEGGSDAQ